MVPLALAFLPALILPAPASPELVEVAANLFVLKGVPTPQTYVDLKRLHITHVIDFRRDGEQSEDDLRESTALRAIDASYVRYAINRTPPAADFSFIRELLAAFPKGARVVLHCSNGNRAAAAACPWLVLDKGLAVEEALKVCRKAGMVVPETEESVRSYLKLQGRS